MSALALVVALAAAQTSGYLPRRGAAFNPLPARATFLSVDAGEINAESINVGTLDAGEVRAAVVYNPDGGRLHVPAGVLVESGSMYCLDGVACTRRIYRNPAGFLVLDGPAGTVVIDGLSVQGIIEANTLQANSLELVGGASGATIRVAAGTGVSPTPDAGLRLEAAGPDGFVDVVRDAGIATRTARLVPWSLASAPACTQELLGANISVAWPGGLADGGLQARSQECDGEHWVSDRYLLDVGADAKAGATIFWVNNPQVPGRVEALSVFVQNAGLGATPYEVILRQGSRVLCRGGGLCTDPPARLVPMTCFERLTFANPDAGLAQRLVAEVDAGCAQTPALGANANVDRFGWPDALWFPP